MPVGAEADVLVGVAGAGGALDVPGAGEEVEGLPDGFFAALDVLEDAAERERVR